MGTWGLGRDEGIPAGQNLGQRMTIIGMYHAMNNAVQVNLANSAASRSKKFDMVGFDACIMSQVSVLGAM